MTTPVLLRSVLYLPASNARALDKARSLPADALIFDLEDAVAPDRKAEARTLLSAALAAGGYGRRHLLVRVNGQGTPWGGDDLAAVARMPVQGVVLPKVDAPGQVAAARTVTGDLPVWAMIETPKGVENAPAIAAADGMAGLILGTNDLLREMQARSVDGRLPLLYALQRSLMAARAAGIACLDGVMNALDAPGALEAECRQGRDLGFDGKTLIHPSQIGAANQAFAPDAGEISLAQRQIAAYGEALARGDAVAVVDGRIVENLHIVTARAILAKARAISEMSE